MEIREWDVFSPFMVVVVILFYLSFAIIGTEFNMRGLKPVSGLTYIYILFGILIFLGGVYLGKFMEKKLPTTLNRDSFRTFLDFIQDSRFFREKIILLLVFLAITLEAINLYHMGGIPLLSGMLKARSFNNLTEISYITFLLSINTLMACFFKKKYFILVLIGVILFALTGYRAITIALVVSILITTFYGRGNRLKYFFIISPLIIILGLIVGYIACISIEWQQWSIDPMSLVLVRAGFTLTVLDKIIHMHNPNPGQLIYNILTGFYYSVDPRLILGQSIFKYNLSITSTIFGPAIWEGGCILLGLQMLFLGWILELINFFQHIKKDIYIVFYSIGLAHTIVWVETGPTDLALWIYYFIATILILTIIKRIKYKSNH